MIYVGTCGFSYRDWIGAFYPPKTKSAEMLPFYARSFRAVEIDSSYYGVPHPRTVASMAARTPPEFRFSFKIPQTVTHPPDASLRVHPDAGALLESVEPMVSAGKLACVLAQFPNSFKPEEEREEYVRRVVEAFEGVPVVVEFRNRLWQRPETIELLRALGAGYCNVDMPPIDRLLAPSSDASGPVGYVRFHGRNSKMWWRGSSVTRYDYLYAPEELVPWTDRIAEIEAQTRDTYAFFNNHANGHAARNAEMIVSMLDERYGELSAQVVAHAAGDAPKQATLPGMPDA
ncbi:MAG: DUF72 domain-containing protein [Candidatus Tumulicola sp.]